MSLAEALRGLSILPLALSIVSLRNHSGWSFELNASVAALRGMRARGALFLFGALMLGAGSVLQAAHIGTGRWAVLVLSTVCAVTFGFYRPRVVEHPGATRHSVAVRHLEPRSRRIWLLLFAASVLLAAWAALPWWR